MQAGGHWRNWVGNQSCIVRHRGAPTSEAALSEMVREATSSGLNGTHLFVDNCFTAM